jgi:hypothetical protein
MSRVLPDLNPVSLHYHPTTLPLYHGCSLQGGFYLERNERKTDTCIFFCLKFIFFKPVASQCQYFLFLSFVHINDTNSQIKAQNKVNYKAAGGHKEVNLYMLMEYRSIL